MYIIGLSLVGAQGLTRYKVSHSPPMLGCKGKALPRVKLEQQAYQPKEWLFTPNNNFQRNLQPFMGSGDDVFIWVKNFRPGWWTIHNQGIHQSNVKKLTTMNYVGVILASMTENMAPSLEDCGRTTWGMGLLCSIPFLFSRFISSRLSRPFFTFTDHSGSSASCWMSRTLPRTYLYKNRYQGLDIFVSTCFRKQQ